MADLSRNELRATQQDRITNNRSGIVPGRRNTEAPELERNADMRAARRGDVGGAEQLMALFGQVNKAAQSFQQYSEQKFVREEEGNAAEGTVDAVTGEFDAAQAERSRAYNVAYTRGRAETQTLTFVSDLNKRIQERLNDPENPADQDDIDEMIAEAYKGYLQPDGKPRDFGSDEARVAAIGHLRQAQQAMRSDALERVRTQVNEDSLRNATDAYRLRLEQGVPTTFEDAFTNLVPGVDRRRARTQFLQTTLTYAESIMESDPERALDIIYELENSTRGGSGPAAAAAAGGIQEVDPDTGQPVAGPIDTDATGAQSVNGQSMSDWDGGAGASTPARAAPGTTGPSPAAPARQPAAAAPAASRRPVNVDNAINYILSTLETGKVVDNGDGGGTTRWGITSRWNPGVDVRNLSQAQAFQIAKNKYWQKAYDGADPAVQAIAFDAGFIHNMKFAAEIATKYKNDPAGALKAYRDRLARIAATSPKHAKFARGWNNRVTRLGNHLGVGGAPAGAEAEAGAESAPYVDPIPRVAANYSDKPESAVDRAGRATGGQRDLPQFTGVHSLSPEERSQVVEFRRRMETNIRATETRKVMERQEEAADTFLDRFSGIGTYPTASEIQTARMEGRLSAEAAGQFVNLLRADKERERAQAERAEDNARADRAEAQRAEALASEERTNRRINALLAPIHRGTRSISESYRDMMTYARSIPDREERQAFLGAVRSELEAMGEARERTPEFQGAVERMQRLQQRMISNLPANLRGERREAAIRDITESIDRQTVNMGRLARDSGRDPAQLADYYERELTDRYVRQYQR